MRVPAEADAAKGPVPLYDIVEGPNTWVGDLYDKNNIATFADYKGNKALTAFLPNADLAMKWKTNGPALPKTIMLPTGSCSWCGTPKDEPKVAGTNTPPPMSPAVDGGTAPEPDAGDTTPPTMVADAGSSGTGGSGGGSTPTVKQDAAPSTSEPPAEEPPAGPTARSSSGGCSVAGSSSGLPVLLMGLLAYRLRRRRS
jgi:MYXO-CTERM domain-containing protein